MWLRGDPSIPSTTVARVLFAYLRRRVGSYHDRIEVTALSIGNIEGLSIVPKTIIEINIFLFNLGGQWESNTTNIMRAAQFELSLGT